MWKNLNNKVVTFNGAFNAVIYDYIKLQGKNSIIPLNLHPWLMSPLLITNNSEDIGWIPNVFIRLVKSQIMACTPGMCGN